jgi:hypothetical protein
MASIDTSIYGGYLKAPKSVAEYDAEHRQAKADQLNLLMAQDKRGEYQRGVQRQGQLDALLRGGATPERLRAGGFLDQANAWEKNSAEVAQKQAAAGKSAADAKATEYKLSRDQIEHLTQGLSQFQSPDDARAYLSDAVARYQAGDPSGMPLHQAKLLLARVPRELNRFGEWKQQALMGVADAKTQMQYTTPDANTAATIKSRESEGGKNRANQLAVAGTVAQAGGQILVTPDGYVRAPKIGTAVQPMTTPDGKPIKPVPKGGGAQLPTPALKMQMEELDAVANVSAMNADLTAMLEQIKGGGLKFGPVKNVESSVRNFIGLSNVESRNLASFKATLEKLRNESLRLNKGVQTDGDAQRAWNELMTNINDTELVKQRLEEIVKINSRARKIRQSNIAEIRRNYGVGGIDTSGRVDQPPAIGSRAADMADAEAQYGDD